MRYNHSVWFVVPKFPGQGLHKEIKVVTGTSLSDEQRSASVYFDYIAPKIKQVSTFEGNQNGQVRLVIDGTNLGVSGTVHGVIPNIPCGNWSGNISDCAASSGGTAATVNLESTCGPVRNSQCWEHEQLSVLINSVCGCIKVQVSSGADAQETTYTSFIDFDPLVDTAASMDKLMSSGNRRRSLISKSAAQRGLRASTYGSSPIGLETKGVN